MDQSQTSEHLKTGDIVEDAETRRDRLADVGIGSAVIDSDQKLGHFRMPPPTTALLDSFNVHEWARLFLQPVYVKAGLFESEPQALPSADLLRFSAEPLTQALTRACFTDMRLNALAIRISKVMLMYTGDYVVETRGHMRVKLVDMIIKAGQDKAYPELIDEIYLQLCRLITDNPDILSLVRGWTLLTVCSFVLVPSPSLLPYLFKFIVSHYNSEGCVKTIAPFCHWRLSATITVGPTKKPPKLSDIEQLRMGRVSSTHVLFGSSLSYLLALEALEGVGSPLPRQLQHLMYVFESSKQRGYDLSDVLLAADTSVEENRTEPHTLMVDRDQLTPRKEALRRVVTKKAVSKIRFFWESGDFEEPFGKRALKAGANPYVYAALLRRWLASQSEPVMCDHMYSTFLAASASHEQTMQAVSQLPEQNFSSLDTIMKLCTLVILSARTEKKRKSVQLAAENRQQQQQHNEAHSAAAETKGDEEMEIPSPLPLQHELSGALPENDGKLANDLAAMFAPLLFRTPSLAVPMPPGAQFRCCVRFLSHLMETWVTHALASGKWQQQKPACNSEPAL
jgi:hypothetical protein